MEKIKRIYQKPSVEIILVKPGRVMEASGLENNDWAKYNATSPFNNDPHFC
ncbi:MAG: hypothetical protein LBS52_08785 [Dysgonamonadaceae bacterium]|jgi:hypothetical protein|nr:hypothetical protein [Dysgonamonadaceae bacterium]